LEDNRPFVVGLLCGDGKPDPLDVYLNPFLEELLALVVNGLEFQNSTYDVKVRCFICDAPARAYLKCIKGHSEYSSCERCHQEGDFIGGKVCFSSKKNQPSGLMNHLD